MGEIKTQNVQEMKTNTIEKFQNIKTESKMESQQVNAYWDDVRKADTKQNDAIETGIPDKFYSTEEQRTECLPTNGEWTGEPGNSIFKTNDAETNQELAKFGLDGIEFKNGAPDFSKCSIITDKIDYMTSDREENRKSFYAKLVEEGYFDEKAEVRQFKEENGLAFHECPDTHTCQFIPQKIHQTFKHKGGVFECRMRDEQQGIGGTKFDE